jgi:hypothetical protein
MSDYSLFQAKSPNVMKKLMSDFDLDVDEAAAVLGNLGHECAGFQLMQEQKPVKGGRGGYGWAQWTGPRRVQFEQWAAQHKLPLDSDDANYGFLKHELSSSEANAIAALRETSTLEDGVRAFEQNFERAGVKHYPSRDHYARLAKDAFVRQSHNGHSSNHHTVEPASAVVERRIPPPIAQDLPGLQLSFGARGAQVKALQEALADLDYPIGDKDGIFGGLTRAAVLAFQADNGLDTDGVVGPQTWKVLADEPSRPLSRDRIAATPADLLELGSSIIANGSKTKGLGMISAILGMLGLTTSAAVTMGGGSATPKTAAEISGAAMPIVDKLNAAVAKMGSGAKPAKDLIAQLDSILAQAVPVSAGTDHAASIGALESIVREALPAVAVALPVPGSLLMVGLGIAAHLFGNRVVQARTRDHRDGSSLGR